jgi:hypothetical protein
MTQNKIHFIRNFLIAAGFYGIYYAIIQFIALLWRKVVVYDRIFSGSLEQFLSWVAWELPFWLFCIIAGYFIPHIIESKRKYTWAIVVGGLFTLHSILFTSVYYAQTPQIFDLTTRFTNMAASLILCPLGVYLHYKHKKTKPEQTCVGDGEDRAALNT